MSISHDMKEVGFKRGNYCHDPLGIEKLSHIVLVCNFYFPLINDLDPPVDFMKMLTSDLHALGSLLHPPHQQQQQGLLHVLMSVDLWGDRTSEFLIESFIWSRETVTLVCRKSEMRICIGRFWHWCGWMLLNRPQSTPPHLWCRAAPRQSAPRYRAHRPPSCSWGWCCGPPCTSLTEDPKTETGHLNGGRVFDKDEPRNFNSYSFHTKKHNPLSPLFL